MDSYFSSVQAAFLLFPFLALLITLPYILLQYHKFGAIPLLRTTLVYSFILYLLILYFLVILPLPSIQDVENLNTATTQLMPFQFIRDFLNGSGIVLNDPSTYLTALKHSTSYTVIFNIFLFIPLGIYLRYYFKCGWFKTIMISLLVSLFCEITQLSGLYGIYPRAYRLFDVDDLIINTFGGLLGFFISPILHLFLPSKDELDKISYKKGKQVSFFRKIVAFFIDIIILLFINTILYLFVTYEYYLSLPITMIIYYILIPWITSGRTIGKFVVQIKISTMDETRPKLYQYLIRYGLLYGIILPSPIYIYKLYKICPNISFEYQVLVVIIIIILLFFFLRFLFQLLVSWITKRTRLSHELWSKTINRSTIYYEEKEEIQKPIENAEEKIYNDEA